MKREIVVFLAAKQMARHEEDREDLMKDARALKRRVAFRNISEKRSVPFSEIVVGIRETEFLSIYFDQNAVFHFDAQNRLRRAFVDDYLYRSQGTTLARMKRERTEKKTVLQRHDLNINEMEQFQSQATRTIRWFLDSLNENRITINEIIPAKDDSLVPEIIDRLNDIDQLHCPLSPVLPTKPN